MLEETSLWQRSRDRKILEGVRNNAYFHSLANRRHRKNTYLLLLLIMGLCPLLPTC